MEIRFYHVSIVRAISLIWDLRIWIRRQFCLKLTPALHEADRCWTLKVRVLDAEWRRRVFSLNPGPLCYLYHVNPHLSWVLLYVFIDKLIASALIFTPEFV